VLNFGFVLLLTGYVTTTMLRGNAVLCLDAYPEWQHKVRTDRTLALDVIEEPPAVAPAVRRRFAAHR
jgi:cytochrome P450